MSITCKNAVEFIAKNEEGRITAMQKVNLWKHMAVCSLCSLFYKQNGLINASIKKANVTQSLTAKDKKSILATLEKEM